MIYSTLKPGYDCDNVEIKDLLNKVFKSVEITNADPDDDWGGYNDCVVFTTVDDEVYVMMHTQDCCERVYLESVDNDTNVLVGSQILVAEERTNSKKQLKGSETWTFYLLGTNEGCCNFRWYGSSNGYYSEGVNLYKITDKSVLQSK